MWKFRRLKLRAYTQSFLIVSCIYDIPTNQMRNGKLGSQIIWIIAYKWGGIAWIFYMPPEITAACMPNWEAHVNIWIEYELCIIRRNNYHIQGVYTIVHVQLLGHMRLIDNILVRNILKNIPIHVGPNLTI